MPPKRKNTSNKIQKATPVKKLKTDSNKIKTALTKCPSFSKKTHIIDKEARNIFNGGNVVDDYDCMLNQTNIDGNNNKYYVLQMILYNGNYFVWTRWGRVGETGQNLKLGPYTSEQDAFKMFNKKFNDKTRNNWENRDNFKAVKGKYTLLEMGNENENEEFDDPLEYIEKIRPVAQKYGICKIISPKDIELLVKGTTQTAKFAPSKLDKETQFLVDLMFQTDMFNHALTQLKLDTKKLPLGKLSKAQIMKGFEVLEELQDSIVKKKTNNLSELSSKFYTIIPHDFGRSIPPKITTVDEVRVKMDMLLVLTDIESTQTLLKNKKPEPKAKKNLLPNPLDEKFEMLDVDLNLIDRNHDDFKTIEKYVDNTKCRKIKIVNIWKVNRRTEDTKFRVHKNIANRKLLWHGTNIAVVAAILKSGLRIMPHSGGRVGKGIYFASENGKSSAYVACNQAHLGVMFLNEVALGKEKPIYQDDGSLVKPPPGFESVVAQGITEPDSKFNKEINIDGKKIIVPIGKPVKRNIKSSFGQSEYLIYEESQCRIRYLLLCQF